MMYSNNILNFQESTTILNARTKKVWKLIECTTYIPLVLELFSRRIIIKKTIIPQISFEISCAFFSTNDEIMDLKGFAIMPTTIFLCQSIIPKNTSNKHLTLDEIISLLISIINCVNLLVINFNKFFLLFLTRSIQTLTGILLRSSHPVASCYSIFERFLLFS